MLKKTEQSPKRENKKNRITEGLVYALLAAYELFYFRKALNGQVLFGLSGDSFLVNMILEHWHDVFSGRESVRTLASFWPAQGSLGYSDAMLGPGLIYSFLRIFISEPFAAFNPALILMHLAGVMVFYHLLRKAGCSIPISLTGIFLSLWSCSFMQLSYHTQFFSLALVPVLYLCLFTWWKRRGEGIRIRLLLAFAATVLYGLLWLSAFYAAYFITLQLAASLLIYGILCAAGKSRQQFGVCIAWIRKYLWEVLACALMQILWIVPFLWIYLPAYAEKKDYDREFVLAHAPDVWDLLRTDSLAPVERVLQEYMPAELPESLDYLAANRRMETSYGWALVTFLMFMLAVVSSILKARRQEETEAGRRCGRIVSAAGLALLLVFLLSCRYGSFLPWGLLRHILPGADTIRVSGRCMGILTIPMAVIVCIWLRKEAAALREETDRKVRSGRYALVGLAALALIWSGQATAHMNEDTEMMRLQLQQIPAPPKDCRVIFLCPTDPEGYNTFEMNMKGWLLADRFGLQTINGYSGSYPAGWYLITDDIPAYYGRLLDWMEYNGITDTEGIYGWIEGGGGWISYSDIGFRQQDE